MLCHKFEHIVTEYIDDTLSIEGRALWDAHLANCSRCRRTLKETRSMLATLAGLPAIEPSEDFHRRLRMRMNRELESGERKPLGHFWFQPGFVSVSVFLFLMFFSSILYFQMKEQGLLFDNVAEKHELPATTSMGKGIGDSEISEQSVPAESDGPPRESETMQTDPSTVIADNERHVTDSFFEESRTRSQAMNDEKKEAVKDNAAVPSLSATAPVDTMGSGMSPALVEHMPAAETTSAPPPPPTLPAALSRHAEERSDADSVASLPGRPDGQTGGPGDDTPMLGSAPERDKFDEQPSRPDTGKPATRPSSSPPSTSSQEAGDLETAAPVRREAALGERDTDLRRSTESKSKAAYAGEHEPDPEVDSLSNYDKNRQTIGIYVQGTGMCLDTVIAELSPECRSHVLSQDSRGDLIARGEIDRSGSIVLKEPSSTAAPACQTVLNNAITTQQRAFRQTQLLSSGTQLDFVLQPAKP